MNDRKVWPALDILRGIAVLYMLVNHVAVAWLKPEFANEGIAGILNFVGSFAPVLFFFTTGLGYGVAHKVGHYANFADVAIKAGILILADIFMRGGDFLSFGWDFLAFIGFSMLILSTIRGRKYALTIATLLMAALFLIRYILGSEAVYARFLPEQAQTHFVLSLLGREGFTDVSYWFTPWLIYPLAGFVIGATANKIVPLLSTQSNKQHLLIFILLVVGGVLSSLVSYMLLQKGAILFRWGTMSINFFIASIAMVCLCLAVTWLLSDILKKQRLNTLLSMRGVSSLAIVPIHYFVIKMLAPYFGFQLEQGTYLLAILFLIPLCFYLARLTDKCAKIIGASASRKLLIVFILLVAIAGLISTLGLFHSIYINHTLAFIAQIILCLMLGFSYSKRKT